MLVFCLKERKCDENPYYHTAIFGSRLVNDLVSISGAILFLTLSISVVRACIFL